MPKEIQTKQEALLLIALIGMWQQYCPPPYTHMYMAAGEMAEDILGQYGVLTIGGEINWDRLKQALIDFEGILRDFNQ